jgi:RNA polymerase sigma-70 factor (TIGR02943 family)
MEFIKEDPKKVVEKWVNHFSDELFSWAMYKTSSKETAEDLVQETFLAAFHKIDTYQGKSQPRTWLFSILNNKVIDYYRLSAKTTKRNYSMSENSASSLADGLFDETERWKKNEINPIWDQEEELLDNTEFNNVMKGCMDDLPQKWKYAITSKYLTDKKTNEICQELEITVSNYWQVVHRAKLLLKNCIEVKWTY